MKIGDKIKVKPSSTIRAFLDADNLSLITGRKFLSTMEASCGRELSVINAIPDGVCLSDGYYYDFNWVSLLPPDNIWNDGSIEQRSLNLALLRQTQVGNIPDIHRLTNYGGFTTFPTASQLGFNYESFPKDGWSGKIALNIPDWKWLNLDPKIVERALTHMKIQKISLSIPEKYPDNIALWFMFPNEEYEYWGTVGKELLNNNPKQIKEYENRLQEERASLTGDCGQTANRVCYRKSKAEFVIRHISHKGSPFRC